MSNKWLGEGAALTMSVVVALVLEGCSWIVAPDTRQNWVDRLEAAESNLKQERLDIEAAGRAARENQLGFISDIESLKCQPIEYGGYETTPGHKQYDHELTFIDCDKVKEQCNNDRDQILQWSKSQDEACTSIKDIEQDMALLRDEMSEEGF